MNLNKYSISNGIHKNDKYHFKDLIRIEYSKECNRMYIVPCGCLYPEKL